MKNKSWWIAALCVSLTWLVHAGAGQTANEATARITKVQVLDSSVLVEVEASGDLLNVVLESSSRVGRRAWEPRAVRRMQQRQNEPRLLVFDLPRSSSMEILRVRAEASPALPPSMFEGTNNFATGGGAAGGVNAGPGVPATGMPEANLDSRDGNNVNREVAESDIYKLSGDTLFFFNQYRGLQVLDVSDPNTPRLTGSYELAASGEQMYLLGTNKVVLLARNDCAYFGSAESKVVLLEVVNGQPLLVKELPVQGYIQESRMVGSALYLAAYSYRSGPIREGGETWSYGTLLASFDLSDFQQPVAKPTRWTPGAATAIYATDQFLFLSFQDYDQQGYTSRIEINDISDPSGDILLQATLPVPGTVQDKFKMHQNGETFTVVTFDWMRNRETVVRTFSLSNPKEPKPLGSLKVIENEQLHATRFHGDLLYAVTFFVIDPLWIIDLSNPASPRKVGELEIPGWSTYLQPLGDKLLAIGREQTNNTSLTTVQLFDVSNPANPTLASKVFIGKRYSGSEANWDEKAFGVFPDENLLLVPFYSYDENESFQGVQLIDLLPNSLVKRGVIEQKWGSRRAVVHQDRILSLSAREILSVNAEDRDHPEIVGLTVLSWAADRVHLAGDHLIEIDAHGSEGPRLQVVLADTPSELIQTLPLENLPYLGSVIHSGKLYVLQGKSSEVIWPAVYDPENWRPIGTNEGLLVCTSFSLDDLPEVRKLDRAEKAVHTDHWLGNFDALSVAPDLLVWSSSQSYGRPWWGWGGGLIDLAEPGAARPAVGLGMIAPFWWGGGSGHFVAVKTAGALTFGAEVRISSPENNWWNFGKSFTSGGLVYTSHQTSTYDPELDPPPYEITETYGEKTVTRVYDPPRGVWVQRYFLDVIDFNDPDEPLVRKPVNIPGSLIGLHQGGEILYTKGPELAAYQTSNKELLAASAYDGLEARLVDSVAFDQQWPRPVISAKGHVYVGEPAPSNDQGAVLVYTLTEAGKLEAVQRLAVDQPMQHFVFYGDLLVGQGSDLSLFDATAPAELRLVGRGGGSSCYGMTLEAGDGHVERGAWIPMGWHGVIKVPVSPEAP